METSATKQRILNSAISLFNDYGIANVRLTQISDDAGISVGNLAYHYKNKDAIVEAVYAQLLQEFGKVLSEYLTESTLLDFEKQLGSLYVFFKNNRFYLFNVFEIERSYPVIHNHWQRYISKMIMQIRKRLDFLVDSGSIKKELNEGDFDLFSQTIWITITFWIPQQVIIGKDYPQEIYRKTVWSLVTPYLTQQGRMEYELYIQPLIKQEENH